MKPWRKHRIYVADREVFEEPPPADPWLCALLQTDLSDMVALQAISLLCTRARLLSSGVRQHLADAYGVKLPPELAAP